MKVGIKGKGAEIKWVDEKDLPIYKKLQEEKGNLLLEISKLKELIDERIDKVKLENIDIIKKVISR